LHDSASKVSKLLLRDGLVKKEDALDKLANATWLPRDED
jgi:hypothetical protein